MERPRLTLSGDWAARPKTALTPGNWYVVFQCAGCGRGVALLDDPTGSGDLAVSGDARIALLCPNCGARNAFAVADARILQASTGGVTAPPEMFQETDDGP